MEVRLNLYRLSRKGVGALLARAPKKNLRFAERYSQFQWEHEPLAKTIGRELYTAPFIWIPASSYNVKERNGKTSTYDHFRVVKVKIEDGIITGLAIANDTTGKLVFTYVKD